MERLIDIQHTAEYEELAKAADQLCSTLETMILGHGDHTMECWYGPECLACASVVAMRKILDPNFIEPKPYEIKW